MGVAQENSLKQFYGQVSARMAANPEMGLDTLRDMLEGLHVLASEPVDVTYENVDSDGIPGIFAKPAGAANDRVIVYTHGGGCVTGSPHSHRKLAAHLAKAAGVQALVVDYRLAPEHPFPSQIDDLLVVHRWLRRKGFAPAHTATVGDSAGANLAITTVLKLRELGEALPAAIVGFSPWLDMEGSGKTMDTNADSDAVLSRGMSEMMSAMYLGDVARNEPLANPLYADLAGLPPMYLSAGDAETLLDNAERIAARARAAGVDVTLDIKQGQQHVYPFMAGRSPEANATLAQAGAWLQSRLGLR